MENIVTSIYHALFTGNSVHFWSVLALLSGLSYWVWLLLGRKIGLFGRKKVLVISVSLLASIWFYRIAYSVFLGICTPATIFENLVKSIKTFSVDEPYIAFAPPISRMLIGIWNMPSCLHWLVKAGFTILYFLAPVTGAVVILNVILHFFSKVRLSVVSKLSQKHIFYFSKLNDSAYALAKNLCEGGEEQVVPVFTDAYLDDEEEKSSELFTSAKSLGAICLKDDILHLPIRKKGKKTLVLMEDDEIKNVQTLLSLIEQGEKDSKKRASLSGAEVLLFSDDRTFSMISEKIKERLDALFCEKPEERPRIRTVNSYGNMVKNMLKEMPLYEPLIGAKDKKDLYLTIIGAGKIGTEVFLSAYWYGQILGCRLHITVVSQESEISFLDKINFINPEIFGTAERVDSVEVTSKRVQEMFSEPGSSPHCMQTVDYKRLMLLYPHDGTLANPYFTFRYYQTDIRDDDLSHKLETSHWEDGFCLKDTDYFAVALGGDAENLQVAEKLNKYISEYHLKEKASSESEKSAPNTVIACAVYNSAMSRMLNQGQEDQVKNWGTYLYAFGAFEDVYTKENIYMHSERKRAEGIQNAYDSHVSSITFEEVERKEEAKLYQDGLALQDGKRTKTQYDYWANLARALHLQYKVFSAGLFTDSVFTCGSLEERKKGNRNALKTYSDMVCTQKPDTPEAKKLVHALSWLEHRRWCAYTRVSGFTCPENYEYYESYTKSHKEMKLKLHPCLVEGDLEINDAPDSLDLFCIKRGTNFKEYDHPREVFGEFKEEKDHQ